MKRTKIICTIGPACDSVKIIKQLAKAGMNVARLNFSHGTHAHHAKLIRNVRTVSRQLPVPLAIMQDLQGPRLRLGQLPAEGIAIKRGETVCLSPEGRPIKSIAAGVIILPTQVSLGKIVKPGELILIKDGLVRLRAAAVSGDAVWAKVEQGDVLTSNRGINLPESKLPDVVLTPKDKEDVRFGLAQKVDWLALSFVRSARDIKRLRALLPRTGNYRPKIVAKIERREAVDNFDGILAAADAIMIARGDLGIELPSEEIPILQKQFVTKCVAAGKPVIVATQMLESMVLNPRPTRAEVSDVANAVIDHTDAVMLSGETSTGKYPVESCALMSRVIGEVEASPYDDLPPHDHARERLTVPRVIAHTAEDVVEADHIRAIVVMSSSGASAQLVAAERPAVPIVALTQNREVQYQLALVWGVYAYLLPRERTLDGLIAATVKLARRELSIKKGEKILIASGHPTGPKGSLNLLKIHTV